MHRITRDDIMLECTNGLKYCVGVGLLWWLPKLARNWISQADKVVCVSRRQANIILDQMPELRSKIKVMYNPPPPELINREQAKNLSEVLTFLYLGGDSYIKGFHILLQALRELGESNIRARFILAGSYQSGNLTLLKKLGEKYRSLEINVKGKIGYEEVLDLHNQAWALLFPSISEKSFPNVVVEATLPGTILIAAKVGGVIKIVEGTTASTFMFTPSKVYELIENIKKIFSLSISEIGVLGYRLKEEVLKKLNLSKLEENVLEVFASTI